MCVMSGHVQVRKLECLNAYGRNNTSDAIKYYENTINEIDVDIIREIYY